MSIDSSVVDSWTVEQVCQWSLKNIIEKKYASEDFIRMLIDNEIDGSILSDITEEHLEKHFKIRALGKRLKIISEIKKLRNHTEFITKHENTQSNINAQIQKNCITLQAAPGIHVLNILKPGTEVETKPFQKNNCDIPHLAANFYNPSSAATVFQESIDSTTEKHHFKSEILDLERFLCTPEKMPVLSSPLTQKSQVESIAHRDDTPTPLYKNIKLNKIPDPFSSVDNKDLNNKMLETFMLHDKSISSSKEGIAKDPLIPTIDLTSPIEECQTNPSIFERTSVEAYFNDKYKGLYEVDENHIYDIMYQYKNKKAEIIRKVKQLLEEYTSNKKRILSLEEAVLVFIWEEFVKYASLNTPNEFLPQIKKSVGFSQDFDDFYATYMTEIQDHIYQKESLLEFSGMNPKNKNSLTFIKQTELSKKMKAKRLLWKENIRKNILVNGKTFDDAKVKKLTINPLLCEILKPHQHKGVEFLWDNLVVKNNGCILAHSMGLGKTLQVITFIFSLFEAKFTNPDSIPSQLKDFKVLILCPLSVRSNWIIEFKKWIPDHLLKNIPLFEVGDSATGAFIDKVADVKEWYYRGGVLVMSYNYFRVFLESPESKIADESGLSIETCLLSPGPSLVIADEGHILKNPQAKITNFIKKIHTPYKVCLSGYPIQNNLNEYWCMVDFVYPDYLGSRFFFEETFGKPITEALYKKCPLFYKKFGHLKLYLLNMALKNIVHRLDSRLLINDLPSKTEVFISCKLTSKQLEIYNDCLDSLSCDPALLDTCFFYKGNLLTDICNHPQLIKAKIIDSDIIEFRNELNIFDEVKSNNNANISRINQSLLKVKNKYCNDADQFDSESSSKFTILTVIINEALRLGEKMLIFSRSLFMLDHIEKYLNNQRSPILHFRLDGSVSGKDRQKMFDQFNCKNDEHTIFLISTTAGCLGANICGATRIVLYDVDWNPSYAEQAIARSFRYGQTSKTYVYRLYTYGTWEDVLVKCGDFKRTLASRVVDQKEAPANHSKEKDYFQRPPNSFPKFVNNFGEHDSIVDRIVSECSDSLVEIYKAESFFADIEYSLSDNIKEKLLGLISQEAHEDEILSSEKAQVEFFDFSNHNDDNSIHDSPTSTKFTKSDDQTLSEINVENHPIDKECIEDSYFPWQFSFEPEKNDYSLADNIHNDETIKYLPLEKNHSEDSDAPLIYSADFDNNGLCIVDYPENQKSEFDFRIHDSGSSSDETCAPIKSPKRKLSDDNIINTKNQKTIDAKKILLTNTLSTKILPIQFSSKTSLVPPRKSNEDKLSECYDFNTIPEIKKSVAGQDNQSSSNISPTRTNNTFYKNTLFKPTNDDKSQNPYSIKLPRETPYSSINRNFNKPVKLRHDKSSRTFSNQNINDSQIIYHDSVPSSSSFKPERSDANYDRSNLYYKENDNIPHFYLYSPKKVKESSIKALTDNTRDRFANIKPRETSHRKTQRYEYQSENLSLETKSEARFDRSKRTDFSRYESSRQHNSYPDRYKSRSPKSVRDYKIIPPINERYNTTSNHSNSKQSNYRESYNGSKYNDRNPRHFFTDSKSESADRNVKSASKNHSAKNIPFKSDTQKISSSTNSKQNSFKKKSNFQQNPPKKPKQEQIPGTQKHHKAQPPNPKKKCKKKPKTKQIDNHNKNPDIPEA